MQWLRRLFGKVVDDVEVVAEHRHRWVLGEPDGDVVHGVCSFTGCNLVRDFPADHTQAPGFLTASERRAAAYARAAYDEEFPHRMPDEARRQSNLLS